VRLWDSSYARTGLVKRSEASYSSVVIGVTAGSGDPLEGMTPEGLIRTGASRGRVPLPFEPVLADVVSAIGRAERGAAIYLYGSVATGQARVGASDVDLLTLDLPAATAAQIGDDETEPAGTLTCADGDEPADPAGGIECDTTDTHPPRSPP
jgi:hypothetical protein